MDTNTTIQMLVSVILPNLILVVQSDTNKVLTVWLNKKENNIVTIGHLVTNVEIFEKAYNLYVEELSAEFVECIILESEINHSNTDLFVQVNH